jgi:tyrosine-specific transport protein
MPVKAIASTTTKALFFVVAIHCLEATAFISSCELALHDRLHSSSLGVFTRPNGSNEKLSFMASFAEKMGKVDEARIAFPAYDSGEVPRMFSSLEYNKSEQGLKAEHASGSVFGAASLVGGTMVGAGILALPQATAPVGFLPSAAAMGVGWLYMTMSGLLISELCINRIGQSGKPGQGMLDLYETTLGGAWSKVGSFAYFFLHYALMVAYIAQGGANVGEALDSLGLPIGGFPGIGQVLFASACCFGLFAASPAMVAKANNLFVLVLGTAFLGIVAIGATTADFSSLVAISNQHPENVAGAFPIIFLSLVYQNIVPTVVNQLEGDRSKITQSILLGTSIPALMFLAWNAVVLGNVQETDIANIDPLALLQSAQGGNPLLGNLVKTCSSLAILTSLIGFVYGLLDALTDVLDISSEGPSYEEWKAPLFGLVFVPPLVLALSDPEIFFKALDYGGAFGVSTLFLALPPLMVWGQRYGDSSQPLTTKPMVPLGKLALGSMWKAAGTLILEQTAEKLGLLDRIKETFL